MKKCPKCSKMKELEEFYKCKSRKDGVNVYCKECFAVMQKENYQYLKGLGICTACRNDYAMIGSVRCPKCADKMSISAIARYERQSASPEWREHRRRRNTANEKKRRQRRRNAGICHECGKNPIEKGYVRCYECLIKRRRQHNTGIPRNARPSFGLCYFCGEPVLHGKKVCEKHLSNNFKFTGAKNDKKGN